MPGLSHFLKGRTFDEYVKQNTAFSFTGFMSSLSKTRREIVLYLVRANNGSETYHLTRKIANAIGEPTKNTAMLLCILHKHGILKRKKSKDNGSGLSYEYMIDNVIFIDWCRLFYRKQLSAVN